MEDIARGAGISRPNLYNYFRNKDELMVALVEQMAMLMDQRFFESPPIQGPSEPLFMKRMAGGIPIGLQGSTHLKYAFNAQRASNVAADVRLVDRAYPARSPAG